MNTENNQQIAKNKIKIEISKKINSIIELSKKADLGELFSYIHFLHITRVNSLSQNIPVKELKIFLTYSNQYIEVYKYLIQILYVKSIDISVPINLKKLTINSKIYESLIKLTLDINSKYEYLNLITMTENLKIYENRFLKIDFEEVFSNPKRKKFFDYCNRIDNNTDLHKKKLQLKNEFLNNFEKEYSPYSDLFKNELNIELKSFIKLIDFILTTITKQINKNERNFVKSKDKIDVYAFDTIINFTNSLFITKNKFFDKFGNNVKYILDKLTFDISLYNPSELRFNQIARQPIFNFGDKYLISPELLLDSLFINLHYTLLEGLESKEKYKAKYSSIFLDKIVEISKKYGFEEFDREIDLYEGKKQIGDIDLIIKNSKNEFLLIEAKNHAIPLDVYFHDFKSTMSRLENQKKDWEEKVENRRKHLLINHSKYGIPSNFRYIIVSKNPEILSHFSDYLTLCIEEFDIYLKQDNLNTSFQEICNERYNTEDNKMTSKQLKKISTDLRPGMFFKNE